MIGIIKTAWRVPQGTFAEWLPAMRQRILFHTFSWLAVNEFGVSSLREVDLTDVAKTRRIWSRLVLAASSTDPYTVSATHSLSIWYHRAHFYVLPHGIPDVIDNVPALAEEYGEKPEHLPVERERRRALWSMLLGERGSEVMTNHVFDPRSTSDTDFRWAAKDLLGL